ncbi:MAG TPA: NAD(P)/FAD-dependent oxidoreductase [Ktedonobacteraceae bacterium]|nr:NAD(P)/FAD-dependent oxidoreductase [Ktedonobacteraceae bacterium]
MKRYDIIIVGGGPAGSTTATLTKHYAPHLRILLLEKAHFPRHHVGESLLAGASPVLQEMEAYDKVDNADFVEKLGATYIWGQDRHPWGFEFDNVISQLVKQGKTLPKIFTKAWQVKRAEYDHLLLKHAVSKGVEVKQGARVVHVLRNKPGGRVTGVEYRDDKGTQTIECTWLMDCSGQSALLGNELGLRQYDERMNNYALFGYWKGAKWIYEYVGHPDLTRICIITTPRGWIWYIPMSRDVVGVGFVTHRQTLKHMPNGPEQLYREELAACPEIRGLLDKAYPTRIARDQKKEVCAIQDWSYMSRQVTGPGWAMVGDSAGFVDPILSSGVMLAHELGQKAAYALNSSFSASSDDEIRSYWQFYEDTYRTYLKAYRDMASFWYSNNFSMETWFWEARRTLAQSESEINLTDREAFNRIASGYATRAESLSLFGSYPLHEAQQLVDGLFGIPYDKASIEARYAERPLLLSNQAQLTNGMYFYQGAVRTTRRVLNKQNQNYLDLHPAEEILLNLFDGQHTLSDLNNVSKELQSLPETASMPIRNGTDLVIQLDNIGALA